MKSLLHLDRALKALITLAAFWFMAALTLANDAREHLTKKGRMVSWLIDTCLIDPFGRVGGAAMLIVLGLFAATVILVGATKTDAAGV